MRPVAIVGIRMLPLDALFPVILTVSFHLRSEEQVQTDSQRFVPAELYVATSTQGVSAGTTVSAKLHSKAWWLFFYSLKVCNLAGVIYWYRQNIASVYGVTSSCFPIHESPFAYTDFGVKQKRAKYTQPDQGVKKRAYCSQLMCTHIHLLIMTYVIFLHCTVCIFLFKVENSFPNEKPFIVFSRKLI